MKTLRNFDVKNKRILVRCDFNVPLDNKGNILDDFRIKATIPTIEYLIKKGAKVILMSHLGRPTKNKKFSLIKVSKRLEKLSGRKVKFLNDCIGKKVEKEIKKMRSGQIIFLENLRFYKREEKNDPKFAKELAELGDIYINDAFGACHRAHASIVGIPKYLPSGAGFLLEKEIKSLSNLIKNPKKPLIAIIGGAKAETKIKLIDKISEVADFVFIGDLLEKEMEDQNYSALLKNSSPKANKLKHPEKIIKPIEEATGRDIGFETIKIFKKKIKKAKTVFWNGPLGKIEKKEFQRGTVEIAKAIIKSKAFSIIGGGETVEFLNKIGLIDKFNHVSTGGGAMLAFLSGKKLPGLEVLK